jgi:hypothetical protein
MRKNNGAFDNSGCLVERYALEVPNAIACDGIPNTYNDTTIARIMVGRDFKLIHPLFGLEEEP